MFAKDNTNFKKSNRKRQTSVKKVINMEMMIHKTRKNKIKIEKNSVKGSYEKDSISK